MTSRHVAILGTVALHAALASCATDGSGDRRSVTDSAGIRVVDYRLDRASISTFRSVEDADLEIGIREGPTELAFSTVVDAVFGPEGTLLVSDALSRDIRVFAEDGSFVRRLGQAGDGPGEFAVAPVIAGLHGDTVFAYDARASRVTTMSLDGALLGTRDLGAGTLGRPRSVSLLADGSLVALSDWAIPDVGPPAPHDVRLEMDSAVVRLLAADGSLLDTLGVVPDVSLARMIQSAGDGRVRVMEAPPPYMARFYLPAEGTRLAWARSDALRIEIREGPADVATILSVAGVEHRATAQDIRSHQEATLRDRFGDGELDPAVMRLNLDFLPEQLPAFADLRLSPSGDVWVALSELGGAEGYDWLVFSPDGDLRGKVRTPPGMRLFDIEEGHLLGVVRDELDVPFVRRYPLREGG